METVEHILHAFKAGRLDLGAAARRLGACVQGDLGFAHLDMDRWHRRGLPEVIYSPGKTAEQVVAIMRAMHRAGQSAFATRVSAEQVAAVRAALPQAVHHADARALTLDSSPLPRPRGLVAVVCAGTSDLPVASEAALTARRMGARVELVVDVGVAGIHRLVRHLDLLRRARCVVVVAGMEGALPSVVGGLIRAPLIAVPTSVGYGTGQGGQVALMAMLNSCVPGISVVNIDNGFGAGVSAALINSQASSASRRARPARANKRV
jgi:NCAIR mutase (PurE)-related protein